MRGNSVGVTMPKNKPLETSRVESIETAWHERDEVRMMRAVVAKYARVLDMTDSGRDIRPLATGMYEAIDRLRSLEAEEGADSKFDRVMLKLA